ncbi:M57 family metalloprotease [Chitinophaga sp. 22321]|uniref:Matrixin family metalloprotease n=1 Tax=Chitinophaga hostae TaxID=2831022 RepID=A0ABS5ITV1_9BACT|nr:M57 family metalloprotease [Chitinophaga hostae]MBS0026393.1 matrixin family metalloprotease [Chitinophaga hostae]
MKMLKLTSLVIIISCIFFSCKKSEPIKSPEGQTAASKALLEKLIEYGFKKDRIQDLGKYYVVGDLLFNKELTDMKKLEAYYSKKNVQTEQTATYNLISGARADNIKFSVAHVSDFYWQQAIYAAFTSWAGVHNSKINFHDVISVDKENYADIIFKSDEGSLPSNVIAAAEFPTTNGAPGFQVLINYDFNSGNISNESKRYNMAHEIGHCLGLRHTNWQSMGEPVNPYGANQIPGTPSSDINSVMNGGTALFSWNGFSQYDTIAVNYLYPFGTYDKWITAPGTKYTYTNYVTLYNDNDLLEVRWDKNLVSTTTVTIEFYQYGVKKGNFATSVPNTGSYARNRVFMRNTFHSGSSYNYENICQIKIIADSSPSVTDITSSFTIFYND